MYISHITSQVSPNRTTLFDLVNSNEISTEEAKVFHRLMGLNYIARDSNLTVSSQVDQVIEKCLDEYPLKVNHVKYILFAHTADYVSPITDAILPRVRKKYEFIHAKLFASSLYKCATPFYFIKLANILFQKLSDDELILLLIADVAFTEILKIIPGSTVLGDAASIVLLKNGLGKHRLMDCSINTRGEFSKGIYANDDEKLVFQSRYVEIVAWNISHILKKNKLQPAQIKCLFPHNVNISSWRQIALASGFSFDQIFLDNVSKMGHCFGSDPFVNLKDGIKQKKIKPGDYYLLATVGLGATFSILLFQY